MFQDTAPEGAPTLLNESYLNDLDVTVKLSDESDVKGAVFVFKVYDVGLDNPFAGIDTMEGALGVEEVSILKQEGGPETDLTFHDDMKDVEDGRLVAWVCAQTDNANDLK